jgi:hypothetical protein
MFRPARSHPNGFDASGSGDLTLLPPTTLTEAFVAAHTDVLCQILQAQQQMAQLRTMCGSRTGGWSLPCVMSD